MWPFSNPPGVVELTDKVKACLIKERGVHDEETGVLRMMEQNGQYADRKVTYFRVFDPRNEKWANVQLKKYEDLDARRILYAGHVERDGNIVLNRQSSDN